MLCYFVCDLFDKLHSFFPSVQNIFSKFEMATNGEVSSIISLTTGKIAKMILDKIFFEIKIIRL